MQTLNIFLSIASWIAWTTVAVIIGVLVVTGLTSKKTKSTEASTPLVLEPQSIASSTETEPTPLHLADNGIGLYSYSNDVVTLIDNTAKAKKAGKPPVKKAKSKVQSKPKTGNTSQT